MQSTDLFLEQINAVHEKITRADALVIGAGAGLSTSAGLDYGGERFKKNFPDFIEKYSFTNMYTAGFYPFANLEEYWAYWSRHIFHNRYEDFAAKPYEDLLKSIHEKTYFVLTTNVDHLFQRNGFAKEQLFYTQGDYGLWQCSVPCHEETYDNEQRVKKMVKEQKDMKIPTEDIPYCPYCGKVMSMNLRCDDTFVQDAGWYEALKRYQGFMQTYGAKNVLFLELGVGGNTPGIIKYPFWENVAKNPQASYVIINKGEAFCPPSIQKQSICIDADIKDAVELLRKVSIPV